MALARWSHPPRLLHVLFLALTVLPGVVLGWLTWQFLAQEQALERRRAQERTENLADLISATLQRNLAEFEERLSALAAVPANRLAEGASRLGELQDDAVLVVAQLSGLDAYPASRVLYYPSLPRTPGPPATLFEGADLLEFRDQDYGRAIDVLREIAESDDAAVRAQALLAIARNLRKTGRLEESLAVYSDLTRLGATQVGSLPAELVARHARCALLADMQRIAESRKEAGDLYSDLQRGRWRLLRSAYRFYAQESRRRLGQDRDPLALDSGEQQKLALSAGVELLWDQWQAFQNGERPAEGRQVLAWNNRSILLIWRSGPERIAGLVAGPAFCERQWLGDVLRLADRQHVRLVLTGAEGQPVFGPSRTGSGLQVVRVAADTGLPWGLRVTRLDAGDSATSLASQRLLMAGLALVAIVILSGGYFTARAVSREVEAARLKSDFVAAVSHEFRTPLTPLCQLAELFAQGRVVDEEQRRQYYDLLALEARRLRRLVEGLLDFGRMEGGAREYRFETLDAAEVIRQVVAEFQEEVSARGYNIALKIAGDGLMLRGDEEALRRALWNLLDNAVKYSPHAFTIRVEVAQTDKHLSVAITDQGLGIPTAEQKDIFKKFVRGSSSRSAQIKGSGIGLSMVDHIVRAHKGRVTVESEPGKGSTFTVSLPLNA